MKQIFEKGLYNIVIQNFAVEKGIISKHTLSFLNILMHIIISTVVS